MSRRTAHGVLKAAFEVSGFNGHLAELARRGYNLSKLQENETTVKIVKIGETEEQDFTMIDNTRNTFASLGLEILKKSVLLVLYEEHKSGERRRLTRQQISQRLDIKKPGGYDINNVSLIEGILIHLQEDRDVESNAVNRWKITEKGVSVIEI